MGVGNEGGPVAALGSMGVAPVRNRSLVVGAGDRGLRRDNTGVVVIGARGARFFSFGTRYVLLGIPDVCHVVERRVVLAMVHGDRVPAHACRAGALCGGVRGRAGGGGHAVSGGMIGEVIEGETPPRLRRCASA